MGQGLSGRNGLLCVIYGSTVYSLTAVEGATWNWKNATVNWGGFGNASKLAVQGMPGPATIDISKFAWDDTTLGDLMHDILDAALLDIHYTYYLYPRGGVTTGKYLYGTFTPSDMGVDVPTDDIISQPFGLVQAGNVYRVNM